MQWARITQRRFLPRQPAQRLYLTIIIDRNKHYEAINVERRSNRSTGSPLWWMAAIVLRSYQALQPGTTEFLSPEPAGLVYPPLQTRSSSRWPISVALRSMRRDRSFSRQEACARWAIRELNFRHPATCLTLSPWGRTAFTGGSKPNLHPGAARAWMKQLPSLEIAGPWENIHSHPAPVRLEKFSPVILNCPLVRRQNAQSVRRNARRLISIPSIPAHTRDGGGSPLPATKLSAHRERATELSQSSPQAVVARLKTRRSGSCLMGYTFSVRSMIENLFWGLLDAVSRRISGRLCGKSSEIAASPSKIFHWLRVLRRHDSGRTLCEENKQHLHRYGDRVYQKMFRRHLQA